MDKIQLEDRTIEKHYGRNVDKAPALLERWKKGEGVIPSEADIRLYGTQNKDVRGEYFDTSTLSATKGKAIKVILPYEAGSRELTDVAEFGLSLINPSLINPDVAEFGLSLINPDVAEFGLSLINPNEELVNYGVNLDVDGRWEKLDGNGVYTLQRKGLILNEDLTEAQAMKHKLLLTKLGHPDHVDGKFARSKDEVAEIIGKTFELGKSEYGYDTRRGMMGQYLPDVSDKGVLKVWCVDRLGIRAGSYAGSFLVSGNGRFAFDSVGDAMNDAVGVGDDKARAQPQTLEGMLQTGQTDQIGKALDERDQLEERLSGLTTDQIYSVIGDYIGSANEGDVRKAIDELTKQ